MPVLVLYSLVSFNLDMFRFGLVWFYIIWCVTIVQICYHAKSGACSFKNIGVIPILAFLGFCIIWFGLVWFCIIWCVTIFQIWYHAKSGACSFKNDRVMPILVKFGLVWHVWFGLNFPKGFYDCSMRSYEVSIGFGRISIRSSLPCPALP